MEGYNNRITRLFRYLFLISIVLGGVATSFLFPLSSFAAVFDVSTSADLQSALDTADSNGESDTINIAAGTYYTSLNGGSPFTYSGINTENFALTINGAGVGMTFLDGGDCTKRCY